MIAVETKDRVTRIEFARPEKKNALTGEMYSMLAAALTAARNDPQVRAVLLRGSRDCFTSGNDLADFLKRKPGEASPVFGVFEVLPAFEKPIVAAVSGPAVGIGTTMLLHCDLVYAAPGARFQLPFVPLGIVPEFGSTLLLPMLAGYQRAAELLLLGQPFTAEKAKEAGIVNEVVPEEVLFEKALQVSLALASLPPESIRLTKKLMKAKHSKAVNEQIAEEGRLFMERLASPEAKEAMNAFLEKRKPDFSVFSMRWILFAALAAPLPAMADLYRWVDPQSGSVKFSSLPPPWYGDPLREARAPAVEVIPYQVPGKPPAATADKPAAPRPLPSLEERWRSMLQAVTALPGRADFDRAGQGIQQQVQAYEAVRAELDRQDPGGAARRRADEGGILERLKKGLEAQFSR